MKKLTASDFGVLMRPFACDMLLKKDNKILLIKRGRWPFEGKWALPGGRINDDETAEECLKREMHEETGLDIEIVSFVGLYSDPARDPRKTIGAAYVVRKKGGKLKAGDDAKEAKWFPLDGLPELAFDHGRIIADAIKKGTI